MREYGNCISLIDATYKTMQYDLPLFLVCVRTNVGYCTVAEFVTQSETAEATHEALKILREWNPGWNPPFVLCDYSEAEISAIKATFDSVRIYICDFHREQAWIRWANNSQNGISKPEAEILLSLLRKCAWAPSKDDEADANYTEAVKLLQASEVWRQHENVRSWLLSTWLNISEVSCAYMYTHTIVVTMVTKMINVVILKPRFNDTVPNSITGSGGGGEEYLYMTMSMYIIIHVYMYMYMPCVTDV